MSVASPNRKFQFGASATVAIIAAATIFLMVNYLSSRHYWRWDWTSEGLYTLSGKTRQILDEEVTRKKASVTIDVLLSAGDSLSDSVRELLANYGAACPALAINYYDPASEPLKTEALVAKYGLQSDAELRYVIVENGPRSKQVDITEFVDYDYSGMDEGAAPKIKSFRGEQAITGAIISVTQDKQTSVYFMTGHDEASLDGQEGRGLSQISAVLKGENYKVASWDSPGMSSVPADCDVLIIAGPRHAFLDTEAAAIDAFLKRGGRLLALLDPTITTASTIEPTGLENLMKRYGIELGQDLVVDHRDPGILLLGAGMETIVLRSFPDHPVTKNLSATAVLFRIARSVTPATPAPADFDVTPLAKTSEAGWGARDLAALAKDGPLVKGPDDLPGPVTIGVAVEQKSGQKKTDQESTPQPDAGSPKAGQAPAAKDEPAPTKARMVVIGDSDFATNASVTQVGNLDLALNAIHWLADKESLIGIEPRTPEQITLTLDPSQRSFLIWSVLFGLPGAAAIAGLIVWWKRRS